MRRHLRRLLGDVWRIARRPATHMSLGTLSLGGFVCGVIFCG
jgi:cytochrome c-type protein NapC